MKIKSKRQDHPGDLQRNITYKMIMHPTITAKSMEGERSLQILEKRRVGNAQEYTYKNKTPKKHER